MELATTFTPVELAALALRILPSATQLYAEAHDIIHHSEVLTATSDTDTLPAFYWLTVCARDAAGNHRVIIDLPQHEAPFAASACEKATRAIEEARITNANATHAHRARLRARQSIEAHGA